MNTYTLTEHEAATADAVGQARYEWALAHGCSPTNIYDPYGEGWSPAIIRGLKLFTRATCAVSHLTRREWNLTINDAYKHPSVGDWYVRASDAPRAGLPGKRSEPGEYPAILAVVEERVVSVRGWLYFHEVTAGAHAEWYAMRAARILPISRGVYLAPREHLRRPHTLPGLDPESPLAYCVCPAPLGFPICGWCGARLHEPPPPPLNPFTGAPA